MLTEVVVLFVFVVVEVTSLDVDTGVFSITCDFFDSFFTTGGFSFEGCAGGSTDTVVFLTSF
jgi:hypothetical protein